MGDIQEIVGDDFYKVVDSDTLTIIDVFADWCGPCKKLKPILLELSQEYDINVYEMDIDNPENETITGSLKIKCMPTLIFIRNSTEIKRLEGFRSKNDLANILTDSGASLRT